MKTIKDSLPKPDKKLLNLAKHADATVRNIAKAALVINLLLATSVILTFVLAMLKAITLPTDAPLAVPIAASVASRLIVSGALFIICSLGRKDASIDLRCGIKVPKRARKALRGSKARKNGRRHAR